MKNLVVLITLSLLSTSSFAGAIDIDKSTVKWTGAKKIGSEHYGTVAIRESTFDGETGTITIDVANLKVGDLSGEMAQKLAGHLKNEDFFNVAKFPTATLKVLEIKEGKLLGEMTIKDKTNKVLFPVTKTATGYTGSFHFDRTRYGVVYGSDSFFKGLGDKVIKNLVKLEFNLVEKV